MVKHIQTVRLQEPTNCLSVFDHFVGLARKGLITPSWKLVQLISTPSILSFESMGQAWHEQFNKT